MEAYLQEEKFWMKDGKHLSDTDAKVAWGVKKLTLSENYFWFYIFFLNN